MHKLIYCCLLLFIGLGFASAQYEPTEEEICFSKAFNNASWVQCVSPIIDEIQGEFNVTKMCLSGEVEAMNCLMEKMRECFDILVFAGLASEQAATIDLSSSSTSELVDMTCELYEGECDELSNCNGTVVAEDGPLVEVVQAVVDLCGPKCVHNNRNTCPNLVNFYYRSTFQNFTINLTGERVERTRKFVDGHCMNASDFDAGCTVSQLRSTEFQLCYDEALRNYPSPAGTISCQFFKSMHSCMANTITPACGQLSADLLREAVLLTIPEIPQKSCLQSINAGLRPASSFTLFMTLVIIQAAIMPLLF